ncbi:MAG: CapA family protein [Opitutales bacterium]|nr:CapA family protein [Opitutales bacterium]
MNPRRMNWQTGFWNEEVHQKKQPSILFAADWAPIRTLEEPLLANPGGLYAPEIRQAFAESTLRVVNVETTLLKNPSAESPIIKEGPCFGSPAEAVKDLQSAGFDIALLANNHMGDYRAKGMVSTKRILQEAGLQTVGVGTDQSDAYDALTFTLGERECALVNFHEGEEGQNTYINPALAGWDLEKARAEIVRQKTAGRLVIAAVHGGREFFPVQPRYLQDAYRSLIEAGAVAVIGHHPHVPCGIETWKGCPIVYSQGNFLFWSGQPGLMRRLGYLVRLYLAPNDNISLKAIPYRITPKGLRGLEPKERQWLFAQLAKVSEEHLTPTEIQRYWEAAMDAYPAEEWLHDATGMAHTCHLMQKKDPQGLARLRTRLACPAHYHFMFEGITRFLDGKHGQGDPTKIGRVKLWNETQEDEFPNLLAKL